MVRVQRFADLVPFVRLDGLRVLHERNEDTGEHLYVVLRPEAGYYYRVVPPQAPPERIGATFAEARRLWVVRSAAVAAAVALLPLFAR